MTKRKRERRNMRVRTNGFTMVELLLVLVILGVLAGIVVPKFAGRSKQARVTAAQTEIRGVELALDQFEIDNGFYPTTNDGLNALTTKPDDAKNWKAYLKKPIVADPWKNPYFYDCPGKHNVDGYDLYSTGPDGKSGTDDDVTNWTEK